MNNLHNIASLHRPGVTNTPPAAAGTKGGSDLSSFLSGIVQGLQDAPQNNTGLQKTQAPHISLQNLSAKIALMLKKDNTIPASLQNASPDDIAAKIATLLQKNNVLPATLQTLKPDELAGKIAALLQSGNAAPDSLTVKPSLTSDLTGALSPLLQNAPKNDSLQKIADMLDADKKSPDADLAKMLNDIQPGSGDSSDIAKILAQLQAQQLQDGTATLDPSILQQLKDKIAQLQLSNGEINNDALVQFKADIIQSLKDQGMDQPTIQNYMTALAKSLRQEDTAAVQQPDQPGMPMMPAVTENTASAPRTAPSIPKSPVAPDGAKGSDPLREAQQDAAERITKPSPAPKTDTPARPQQAAAPAQAPAPSPQQNLSTKIAGCGIDANMINALANGGTGLSPDGFGSNGNGQPQDMNNNAALLKPLTTDRLNTQNFTNYLASARTAPSATAQMVSIQMQRNVNAQIDRMTVQLDPADLGRLDIKMKFEKDGSIKAHLTVEKPETLALLQRDSYHLEKVLQKSGLNIDESSLSFDLRQQTPQHNLEGFNGSNKNNRDAFSANMNGITAENTLQAKIAVHTHGYITQSGVNIMV